MTGDGDLCKAYATCKSFQNAWVHGKQFCEKCRGDIRPLKQVSNIVDSGIDPVVNQVLQNTPVEIMPRLEAAVAQIRDDLGVAGTPCSDAEVLVAIIYRLAQRVATLEGAVKRAAMLR